MQRLRASRSAVPLVTGNPPRDEKNQAAGRRFQRVSLPMKRSRRRVRLAEIGVSMFERCTGASTNAPVAGTCSRPSMVSRVHTRTNPLTTARTT